MPLYEYQCRTCAHEFEALIRTGDTPKCTSCGSEELEKLLSHIGVSTETPVRRTSLKHVNGPRKQTAIRKSRSSSTKRSTGITIERLRPALGSGCSHS